MAAATGSVNGATDLASAGGTTWSSPGRAFVDIDSMLRRVLGRQKQGTGFGDAKVGGYNVWLRGYHPLIATLSTPLAAPVVAATRLRSGNTGSARGAASMIAETITTARACGATGEIVVRADSAFYTKTVIAA